MLFHLLSLLLFLSCDSDGPTFSQEILPGDDPNFKIVANKDGVLKSYNRKVVVFGISIYAVAEVEDKKLLHAANIMAQYLDNDEDGEVDNSLVWEKMKEKKAFMVMWKREKDLRVKIPNGWEGQDLGNDETHPDFVKQSLSGPFDASLEEVLHIITHAGYAEVYPDIFGEKAGSKLADAMDKARGGRFTRIPNPYPDDAWYSYDDKTCDYACMLTEYHYWALTSLLGAHANRLNEIGREWRANTPEKLQEMDADAYALLTDPQYHFPRVLPDGTYMR
ncbi:MAG: hypothetical protein AAFR87_27370 [Bacteroidota bacterium]